METLKSKYLKEKFSLMEALDYSFDGIVIADIKGRIVYASKAVERISGISLECIIGKTANELLESGIILSNSRKILAKDPLSIVQKIKTGVEVFITSIPIYNSAGDKVGYISNYREMKELNKLKKFVESSGYDNYHAFNNELKELRNRLMKLDDVIIKSPQMEGLFETILKVAQVDINVLITGESGTGKEIIAKLIHRFSVRKDGPFVQINCGAIPDNLLETELFGYEAGAFTGAQQKGKLGLLEAANGGSILLDEIGDLPFKLQVKILKVLEEQEIIRVGGTKVIKLDIRLIAATNKNIQDMVAAQSFREDLYYRLNIANIHIPPLRERKEDIIPLALYFLKASNKKHSMEKYFSANICDVFELYSWPGNVRELKNYVERMVIFSKHKQIDFDCLPQQVKNEILTIGKENKQVFNKSDVVNYDVDNMSLTLREAKELIEKEMITTALSKYKSTRKIAKNLGVTHPTIVRKIKKYNISYLT